VHAFIRLVGVMNLAVWFGAAVFFTVAAGPAFFSTEMLAFLPRPYAGAAAEVIIKRYLLLQQWCGAIALMHVLVEYLYSGRQVERRSLGVLSGLFVLALAGNYWLVPQMHRLQRTMYSPATTAAQQAGARSNFGLLHGVSQGANLVMIGGVLFCLWRLTRVGDGGRFPRLDKIRS
jgi:hypothetical protein